MKRKVKPSSSPPRRGRAHGREVAGIPAPKTRPPGTTGPHPSASAYEHASPRARFKRTPTSVSSPKPVVGRGGEQGRPGSGIKVGGGFVGKVGEVRHTSRTGGGFVGKVGGVSSGGAKGTSIGTTTPNAITGPVGKRRAPTRY